METSDDGRYELLLKAHEAQTRHLAAERLRVAEQLDDLRAELQRARSELDFERQKRHSLEEERNSLRIHYQEVQAARQNLQECFDSLLQTRWHTRLQRLLRRG